MRTTIESSARAKVQEILDELGLDNEFVLGYRHTPHTYIEVLIKDWKPNLIGRTVRDRLKALGMAVSWDIKKHLREAPLRTLPGKR